MLASEISVNLLRDTERLRAAIKDGVDINACCQAWSGDTSLHVACKRGFVDSALALIEAGGDVDAHNRFGETPLILACERVELALVIDALCAAGADVNAIDPGGRTPAWLCACIGRNANLAALCAAGAAVDEIPNATGNALHVSAIIGRSDSLETLIDAGADLAVRDVRGRTALHLAAYHRNPDAARLLIEGGRDTDDPQARATRSRSESQGRYPNTG